MTDLELARLIRRQGELIARAREVVEQSRRLREGGKHASATARTRSEGFREQGKAMASHAKDVWLWSQNAQARAMETLNADRATFSRSGSR